MGVWRKLVDAPDLGSGGEIHGSSSLLTLINYGDVAELVDASVSKADSFGNKGSSPFILTQRECHWAVGNQP